MTQLDLILTPPTLKAESPVAIERKRLNAAERRLLAHMAGGEWFTNAELAKVAGMRFGARLFYLRRDGWVILDRRPTSGGTWQYKLLGRKDQVTR